MLLAVGPVGAEFRVNSTTADEQRFPDIAADAGGNFVVVWASNNQDGSGHGVYAQRYNAAGVAQGAEFRANTYTVGDQYNPSVAMDAEGDFVIVWESRYQDGAQGGIYGQRYNSAGTKVGSEFRVNTTTAYSQWAPNVAMDADGDFVVTWNDVRVWYNPWWGGGYANIIKAQRFNAAGTKVGGEIRVDTAESANYPEIAMDADGDFVIAWYDGDDNGQGIAARRFNVSGAAQGDPFRVNTYTSGNQDWPTVAMDTAGDFVITWDSYMQDGSKDGVYAQRYNAAGVPQGAEIRVSQTSADDQYFPAIAMDNSGNFVITWSSTLQDGSAEAVIARAYSAAGVPEGNEFRVNTYTLNSQSSSTVAMDADGDYVIVWESDCQDGSLYGVYAQRYGEVANAATAGGMVWNDTNGNGIREAGEAGRAAVSVKLLSQAGSVVNSTTTAADGRYQFTGLRPGDSYSIEFVAPSSTMLTPPDQGTDDAVDSDAVVATGRTAPFVLAASQTHLTIDAGLIALGSISGTAYSDADRDGVFDPSEVGLAGTIVFIDANNNNQLDTGEVSFTTSANGQYALTNLAVGTYRVASTAPLHSRMTAPEGGLFSVTLGIGQAAIMDLATEKIAVPPSGVAPASSTDLAVNTTTVGSYQLPAVAVDALGNYIVAWEYWSAGGTGSDVYARRFRADGLALGNPFRVHASTAGNQGAPAVAAGPDGSFTIAWYSYPPGTNGDVFAQRYDSQGRPLGSELRVNTFTTDGQYSPTIAMDGDGDFVIAWASIGQDGESYGVYAQRFSAQGQKQGTEFRVNSTTASSQTAPAAAMASSGDFVITWQSYNQDGSGIGIYAQRYNATAQTQGSEFRVNSTTAGTQENPAIAMDAVGNFAIVWQGPGGIFAQRYNVAGQAQGQESAVFSGARPAVAVDDTGGFVVAAESNDGSDSDIFVRRYDSEGQSLAEQFRVNAYTAGGQYTSAIAAIPHGGFVATWNSINSEDPAGNGIFARRYLRTDPPMPLLVGTSVADVFRITRTGSRMEVSVDGVSGGAPIYTLPVASASALTLSALSGDDQLILDFTGGNPLPPAGLTFDGGEDNDTLSVIGPMPSLPALLSVENLELRSGIHTLGAAINDLALSIAAGASVQASADLSLASLNLLGSLDLAGNDLLIGTGSASAVESLIGAGQISTSVSTSYTGLTVGAAGAGVLVKYSYNGDANQDGVVNALDYFQIDSGFLAGANSYTGGDFNHDNVVNALDYFLIDSAFLGQSGPLSGRIAASESSAGRPSQRAERRIFSRKRIVPKPRNVRISTRRKV